MSMQLLMPPRGRLHNLFHYLDTHYACLTLMGRWTQPHHSHSLSSREEEEEWNSIEKGLKGWNKDREHITKEILQKDLIWEAKRIALSDYDSHVLTLKRVQQELCGFQRPSSFISTIYHSSKVTSIINGLWEMTPEGNSATWKLCQMSHHKLLSAEILLIIGTYL